MRVRQKLLIACCLVSVLLCGCRNSTDSNAVPDAYGRARGSRYVDSVNGLSVLAKLISRHRRVKSRSILSPEINKFDTIIWCPDSFDGPRAKALRKLATWLNGGYQRQLIVIGRDHDSAIGYWERVVEGASEDEVVPAKRELAKAKKKYLLGSQNADWNAGRYLQLRRGLPQKVKRLDGILAQGIDVQATDLTIGDWLSPGRAWGVGTTRTPRTVLLANGRPLVTTVDLGRASNSVVVVSNGSFLTNFGLVNRENRKLATKLVNSIPGDGRVLILESGPLPIRISETVNDSDHQIWAWIGKRPMVYIVPHFLLLGLLVCFVYFPIFGRPKQKFDDGNETTFRSHIRAVGDQLRKTGKAGFALEQIERYLDRQRHDERHSG